MQLTRQLNHGEMVATLKRAGLYEERPELAMLVLRGETAFVDGDGTEYALRGSSAARRRAPRVSEHAPRERAIPTPVVRAPEPEPERPRTDASAEIVSTALKSLTSTETPRTAGRDGSADIVAEALGKAAR